MKEIVNWLRTVEHLAGEMYQKAASIYSDDEKLRRFFELNAEDEAWHYHVMGSAALFLDTEPDLSPAVFIDKATNEKINRRLSDITNELEKKKPSREKIIDMIVELELSEWNDIFFYAVNFLKDKTSEFKYPVTRIQAHVNAIENFLSSVEHRPGALQKIKELPPIWVEKILIVDDEEIITELIKSILNRSGNIDVAHNGLDALRLMETNYYKLVITDIDMPIMDGLTFYKEVVEKYPESKCRFLFITGMLTPGRQAFFKENQLNYLAKPMSISRLKEEAERIISSQIKSKETQGENLNDN